jgi:hypothetical protein
MSQANKAIRLHSIRELISLCKDYTNPYLRDLHLSEIWTDELLRIYMFEDKSSIKVPHEEPWEYEIY